MTARDIDPRKITIFARVEYFQEIGEIYAAGDDWEQAQALIKKARLDLPAGHRIRAWMTEENYKRMTAGEGTP